MGQVIRCLVTLNPGAATQERITNTWHIENIPPATFVDSASSFRADLDTWYQAVDANLSNELSASVPLFQAWNLLEPKPRQPIYETNMTALNTGTSRLAREVSCCISYRGEYVSGVSPRRRRGRIYLGPLAATTMDTATGLFGSTFISALDTANEAFFDLTEADPNYKWVVYSPTSDPLGTGETGSVVVIGGWVDTLPDTQRRRGLRSGTKTNYG